MKQQTVRIGVDLERELDGDLTKWAAQDERSKRVQVRRIVRHVVKAWKRDPFNKALQQIGLVQNEEDKHAKGLLA